MSSKKSKKKRKYKTVSRRIVAGELDLKYPFNAGCARDSGHRQRAERDEGGPGRGEKRKTEKKKSYGTSPYAPRGERNVTTQKRRRALAEGRQSEPTATWRQLPPARLVRAGDQYIIK